MTNWYFDHLILVTGLHLLYANLSSVFTELHAQFTLVCYVIQCFKWKMWSMIPADSSYLGLFTNKLGTVCTIGLKWGFWRFSLVEPVVRMKALCGNQLDFERYFLRQKVFSWHMLLPQADFHNLFVFSEIYKMMFYFVSKHVRHFRGSTKLLGWKPLTVNMGEVQYFVRLSSQST